MDTDTVITERFAYRLAEHHRGRHDLWVLPPQTYGLSSEHVWSRDTISLVRHQALCIRVEMEGLHRRAVAAVW